jgi:hypothetical protein
MRNFIRITSMIALLASAVAPATAATPSEFYATLLRRGISAYEGQRYADSAKQLRIAAFGLVEAVDQYQVAQVYLTLAYDKLGETDKARDAARRVVIAERVERRWSSVALPAAVRTTFDAQAAKLLTATELATLRGSGPAPAPPSSASTAPRTTTTVPPPTTTATPPRAQTTAQTTTTATPPRSTQTTATGTPPRTTEITVPMPQTTTTKAPPPATVPAPVTTQPRGTTSNSTTNTPTTKPPAPAPAPAPPQTVTATPPRTAPPATQPQRPVTQTTQQGTNGRTTAPVQAPAQTRPAPAQTQPAPQTTAAPAARTFSPGEIATRLIAAERALNTANLLDARRVYRELLASANLPHETLIRIAEGLYRARDFAAALQGFTRAGTLRRGEEPYRYYIAVAAYETGDTGRAKKELAAALPFIEMTPDVARYRARIEGAL